MKPELTISLLAIYVAVVSLTQSIGGATGAIAAALIGVGITIPLLANATSRRQRPMTRGVMTGMAACTLVLASLSFRDGWNDWSENRTKTSIKNTILASYAAELDWYQDPAANHLPLLERYFLPAEQGGERLGVIEAAIGRNRRCGYRMAPGAQGSTFVNLISISGSTARADTIQSLFQHGQKYRDGKWIPRPIQTIVYAPQQYVLQKVGGHWYVASAPQEQNTGEC